MRMDPYMELISRNQQYCKRQRAAYSNALRCHQRADLALTVVGEMPYPVAKKMIGDRMTGEDYYVKMCPVAECPVAGAVL